MGCVRIDALTGALAVVVLVALKRLLPDMHREDQKGCPGCRPRAPTFRNPVPAKAYCASGEGGNR